MTLNLKRTITISPAAGRKARRNTLSKWPQSSRGHEYHKKTLWSEVYLETSLQEVYLGSSRSHQIEDYESGQLQSALFCMVEFLESDIAQIFGYWFFVIDRQGIRRLGSTIKPVALSCGFIPRQF